MERHRGDHQHHHHHRLHRTDLPDHRPDHPEQHSNYYQYQNHHQFNNHNHNHDHQPNCDPNHQMSGEPNEPFSNGGFCFNGRKRGRLLSSQVASPDCNDSGGNAKLYVAPVPRTITEQDIWPVFEAHGSVVEVVLPRDKRSGQQQGYCFVKYATIEEADRAIWALNNQYTVPGEVAPIKVRFADGERERLGCSLVGGFVDKLYVGSINKQASKWEIEEIFSPYGHMEDIYVARDELKQGRGFAFVKFSHRDMALAAIKALNGTFTMRGCDQPLIVRFADPKKPKTGELRGNYAFASPSFGPCAQESMMRPASNYGDSMGGCIMPNASYSMPLFSTNSQPQAVSHMTKQELATPHIAEQPLPPVKQSPSQSSQISLQHALNLPKCCQSSQQAVSEMQKQTQNLEKQQSTQIPMPESWTGSSRPATTDTSAASAVSPNSQTADPQECDWSEHSCPDGYKYYYNCITCESRWEKPEEFSLFQQQLQKQQKLQNSDHQPHSLSPVFTSEEVDQTQKVLLETHLFHQKLQLQQRSLSLPVLDHVQTKSETSLIVGPTCV